MINLILLISSITILLLFVFSRLSSGVEPKWSEDIPGKDSSQASLEKLLKESDLGSILLRLGPVLIGFGFLGYLASEFWNNPVLQLSIVLFSTVACLLAVYFLQRASQAQTKYLVFSEGLAIVGTFLLGASIQSISDYYFSIYSTDLLNGLNKLGVWFLLALTVALFSKSSWVMGVATFINLGWLTALLTLSGYKADANTVMINIWPFFLADSEIIGFAQDKFSYLLVTFSSIVLTYLAFHSGILMTNTRPSPTQKTLNFFSVAMAFLNVGALVYIGVTLNSSIFSATPASIVTTDLILALATLSLFLFDYLMHKLRLISGYDVSWLVIGVIVVLSAISPFIIPANLYAGFYFLEISYTLWILATLLRRGVLFGQVIFYPLISLQLLGIALNESFSSWFKLLLILGIMMYASTENYKNRPLVFYTCFAGSFAVLIKLVTSQVNLFLNIAIMGLAIAALGFYFSQTREKMLQELTNTKKSDV